MAFSPANIGGRPLSPVHFSEDNGVHADLGFKANKDHIPFIGQTTLPTFNIGGNVGFENDNNLAKLGGSFDPPRWTPNNSCGSVGSVDLIPNRLPPTYGNSW